MQPQPDLIQPWHVLALGLFCCLPTLTVGGIVGLVFARRRRPTPHP